MKFHWASKRSQRLFRRNEVFQDSENPLDNIDKQALFNLQFNMEAISLSFTCSFTEVHEPN